jgi:flagellar hook-associated protein 2
MVTTEGKLEISAVGINGLSSGVEKLNDAISNNLDEVTNLFTASDGIVSQITTLIDTYNDSDGSLTIRQTALNVDLSGIADEYDRLEDRLRNYEETLRKRFGFLDSAVAGYSATGAWLKTALKLPERD